jgi:hypothetical protein
MNREQMLIDLLAKADEQIKMLELRAEFLNKEVNALRERINYIEPQVFGGTSK